MQVRSPGTAQISCYLRTDIAERLIELARHNERSLAGELRIAITRHLNSESRLARRAPVTTSARWAPTMSAQRSRKARRATRCKTCKRRIRDQADNQQWLAESFTTHICPECQTEEQKEAVAESLLMENVLKNGGEVITLDEKGEVRVINEENWTDGIAETIRREMGGGS